MREWGRSNAMTSENTSLSPELMEKAKACTSPEELEDLARKWEIKHGGRSGRAAKQLIAWLKAEESAK